jgi:hypothetical protein
LLLGVSDEGELKVVLASGVAVLIEGARGELSTKDVLKVITHQHIKM